MGKAKKSFAAQGVPYVAKPPAPLENRWTGHIDFMRNANVLP